MIRRRIVMGMAAIVAVSLSGCGGPPSIGEERETFKAVDALYTAVSLREVALLDQCETKLKGLQGANKLPDAASRALASIITEARGGAWEPAQIRLGKFMKGQRR